MAYISHGLYPLQIVEAQSTLEIDKARVLHEVFHLLSGSDTKYAPNLQDPIFNEAGSAFTVRDLYKSETYISQRRI